MRKYQLVGGQEHIYGVNLLCLKTSIADLVQSILLRFPMPINVIIFLPLQHTGKE